MEIMFRPAVYGNRHKFSPLIKGIIIADYYSLNGGTHIFKIRTASGIVKINGASLYPDAQVLRTKTGFTIEDILCKSERR